MSFESITMLQLSQDTERRALPSDAFGRFGKSIYSKARFNLADCTAYASC